MWRSTRNRRSSRLAEILVLWLAGAVALTASPQLPVFLADNHGESFAWIARNFDLDRPHVLVLVDAHSDASAAERSDEIRELIRRVPDEQARTQRLRELRSNGRVQAFNWIEPLMPRPIDRVHWLAAVDAEPAKLRALTADAVALLDGRLEVEPRSVESLADRWETWNLAAFEAWSAGAAPVILGLDLDFFSGMPRDTREEYFARIWQRTMTWPGLEGIAVAVSRPWLRNDAEAEALVSLVLEAVRHTRGAVLEIKTEIDRSPDDSLKAREAAEAGVPLPRWDLATTGPGLRARLAALGEGSARSADDEVSLLGDEPQPVPEIIAVDGEIDCDGIWRFPCGATPVLRLRAPAEGTGKVRWFRLEPAATACDLLPGTQLGKGFASDPVRWIHEVRTLLMETTDFQLAPDVWCGGPGRYRITAEYETPSGWLPAGTIELRLRSGDRFRGALSECFKMPYVFGIAAVREGELTGVESGWGADCANLLIHAWRRNGLPIRWGDPGVLRSQLATKAENVRLADRVRISKDEIEAGLAIDFGQHVAAVWEDLEPVGELGGNDLVIHHIGGFPEIIDLATLAETRPAFALRVPPRGATCCVALAGDVVLAGESLEVLDDFKRGDADLFLVNLEGIPSLLEPEQRRRFDFRFPEERLGLLGEWGVDAVSLANNHALDAGAAGLLEGLAAIRARGMAAFGAGANVAEACRPWRVERRGVKLAVFGISCVGGGLAGPDKAGIAGLPDHRETLELEFARAREAGERIIVLLHAGDEYSNRVNAGQRQWAAWLASRGARVVAGSHPHVVQREERHAGALILHSLGNAVYPAALKGADSGVVRRVEIP